MYQGVDVGSLMRSLVGDGAVTEEVALVVCEAAGVELWPVVRRKVSIEVVFAVSLRDEEYHPDGLWVGPPAMSWNDEECDVKDVAVIFDVAE
jgi:hypothetical protein